MLQPANLGLMNSLHLQGVAWFGFNNGATMVDGLYGSYQNASICDFPTVLKRMKLLGFNGLRLPAFHVCRPGQAPQHQGICDELLGEQTWWWWSHSAGCV